ncbi:tetratricopeptide repeat protein [Nonomuraea fuscirosea]|uniref:tetratricopeptide repeat protein n=1 Tax=Nonomuraea fuscirosea TaxID=1291556 RepID=UPI00342D07AA
MAALGLAGLAVRTRVLGPEHPDTLTTRFHWVRAIGEMGHYAEAPTTLIRSSPAMSWRA